MEVIVTPEALKQFKKIPQKDHQKIKKKLNLLKEDIFLGKKLEGQLTKYRSIRVWPYRIIYFIDNSKETIFIISILHRQGAYR